MVVQYDKQHNVPSQTCKIGQNPSIGFTIHCNPQSVSIIYSVWLTQKTIQIKLQALEYDYPYCSYCAPKTIIKSLNKISGVGSHWKCLDLVFKAGKCLKSNNSYRFINYWYTYCTKLYFNGLKAVLTTIYMSQMHGLMDTPSILLL